MVHTETHAERDNWTRLNRKLTSADLESLPHEPDTQYELIEGVLCMTTRPGFNHQRTIMRLALSVGPAIIEAGGFVLPEPGLVFEDDGDSNVVPDVLILDGHLRSFSVPGSGISLARIVAEVVSPGAEARERDYDLKRALYLRKGAREYWIIDRQRAQVVRLVREGNAWQEQILRGNDRLCTPLVTGWKGITVNELFA
jgi:Uma2 family endonuclease